MGGKPVASCAVDQIGNNWHIVSIGGYLNSDQIDLSSQPEEIASLFQEKGVQGATQFSHISLPSVHMDLLYIDTTSGEYFIPLLHARDELYGLNNQQVYTRQQLVAAIGPALKANLSDNSGAAGGAINANGRYDSSNNNPLIAVAGIVIIVAAGTILYRKKRQASNV
jgi:LPXTG-motif cell wall-anchored protein